SESSLPFALRVTDACAARKGIEPSQLEGALAGEVEGSCPISLLSVYASLAGDRLLLLLGEYANDVIGDTNYLDVCPHTLRSYTMCYSAWDDAQSMGVETPAARVTVVIDKLSTTTLELDLTNAQQLADRMGSSSDA
ncbi:hypothetical protein FOZ63_015600, partial [Perkinsus olseni]